MNEINTINTADSFSPVLSEEAKTKYLEHPFTCPFCHSTDISASSVEPYDSELSQTVVCNNPSCGKSWRELYRIKDIEILEDDLWDDSSSSDFQQENTGEEEGEITDGIN